MAQGLCAIFFVKIPFAWFATYRLEPWLFQIGRSTAYAAVFTLVVCVFFTSAWAEKDRMKNERIKVREVL